METLESITITVPDDLASEFCVVGLGIRPIRNRSADWIGIAALSLDASSAVAAVIVHRRNLSRLIQRLAGRARETAQNQITVTVTFPGGRTEVVVEPNTDEGARRVAVRVEAEVVQALERPAG
jgi:hypothetical protein